jgi:hypothetical protein
VRQATHTSEQFAFTVPAPFEEVFPLFGALKEKDWAPDWDPDFVWPAPAADRAGMVFRVMHGDRQATWINTAFDPATGRVQYAYVLPDVLATLITIEVRQRADATHVHVRYERTSLSPDADARVLQMAQSDRQAGPEWERLISSACARRYRRP